MLIDALFLSAVLILDIPEDITQKGRMDMTVTTTKPVNVDRTKYYPLGFNCPCNYRRKLDKDYICWGVRCPMQGLHHIVEEDPIEFSDDVPWRALRS